MERVLGAISAASTTTGRPSSVTRQPEAFRSRSMTRVFSPELEDAIRTSYLMAGGPTARGGFLASSGKAGPRKRRTKKNAAEKANVGLDASDGVLVEGAAEASNGFLTAIAPGNELAE